MTAINTTSLTRLAALLLLLALTRCASIPCHPPMATSKPVVYQWGCPRIVKVAPARAKQVSVTNQADGSLSVLFTGAGASLVPPSTALTSRWVSFLALPVTARTAEPAALRCRITGHIVKSASTHAAAMVDLGGAAFMLDYPVGTALDEEIDRTVEFQSPVGDSAIFPISVVATGTRSSTAEEVLFALDAVDCALASPPAAP